MRFSIIIPVYNAEKYIETTLTEILNQNDALFEIVLVDDGSKDKSGEICDRFAAVHPEQIKVIHQENRGQLAARCQGIHHAAGDYCLFLDADDALEQGCFDEMDAVLTHHSNPDMLIYSFIYEYSDGTSKQAIKLYEGEQPVYDKTQLYKLFFTSTLLNNVWTKLVKRTVLLNCDLDVDRYTVLRCAEDRLHSMEMVTQAQHIVYCDRSWYHYRLVTGSVTRQYTPEAITRFNDADLYGITKEYIAKWQIDQIEYRQRLDAGYVNHTVYVFDLFYKNVLAADRKRITAYEWRRFLPDEVLQSYSDNPFVNDEKKKYLYRILNQKKMAIAVCVRKQMIVKWLRSLHKGKKHE